MKSLPDTKNPLVLRIDFSDQDAWEKICTAVREPVDDFQAYVEFLVDISYQDITKEQLLELVPSEYEHSFIILVDRETVSSPEFPLLIIDLGRDFGDFGREFRAIPSQIQGIENNLSIGNMSFYEFADNVDDDGVFRGFNEI
jgi:hypothetical protein